MPPMQPADPGAAPLAEEVVDALVRVLVRRTGVGVGQYRPEVLAERFATRLEALGERDVSAYLTRLEAEPDEPAALLETLCIPVTRFFRDPWVFTHLVRWGILDQLTHGVGRKIRAWCAGCATGEEAYSLAMLLRDAIPPAIRVRVFATDLSPRLLARAAHGTYSRDALQNVRLGDLNRYFDPCREGFRVRDTIRRLVDFSLHDLTDDRLLTPASSIYGNFDLVSCRNVLIYLRPEAQRAVLERLVRALAPGGLLVLGEAEDLPPLVAVRLRPVGGPHPVHRKPWEDAP